MDELESPYAQQPTNLESPVPTDDPRAQLQALFSQPAPTEALAPPQGAEQATDSRAQLQSLFNQPTTTEPQSGPDLQPTTEPEPEGLASLKEQIKESFARVRHSFAVGDKEQLQAVKEATFFGNKVFEDARMGPDGYVQVKRKGRQGWENMDRNKVELIGDMLDFSRDAVEAGIEAGFKIGGGFVGGVGGATAGAAAGGVAGVAAGAPTGPGALLTGTAGAATGGGLGAAAGAVVGSAVAGGAGAAVALNAADSIAEEWMGIERDPRRSRKAETAIASAAGTMFHRLGARAARKATIKNFRETEARKTFEFATDRMKQVTEEIKNVRDAGLKIDPKNGRFYLDPNQVTKGEIPDIEATAKAMSREPSVQNFKREQGELLKGAYESIFGVIQAKTGRTDVGKDFVITSKDILKAEGKTIGEFRKLAKKELVNQPQDVTKFRTALQQAFQDVGGTARPGETGLIFNVPDTETILQQFPSFTPAQAKSYKSELEGLIKQMQAGGGRLNVDQAEKIYTGLTKKINASINTSAGRPYAIELIKIKDGIRDDWADMIGNVLPDNQKGAYQTALGKFSEFKTATKTLQNTLKNHDISRDALISQLFEGKQSLKFARSAKAIMNETDPKLWQDLTAEYFLKLKNKHLDGDVVNWKALSRDWNKLPSEMRKELLDGSGIPEKGFNSLVNIGRLYDKTNFKSLPNETKVSTVKNLVMLFTPGVGRTAKAAAGQDVAMNMMEGLAKEEAVMLWLKEGGLEEVIKATPSLGKNLRKTSAWRNAINNWAPSGLRNEAIQKTRVPMRRSIQDLMTAPEGTGEE